MPTSKVISRPRPRRIDLIPDLTRQITYAKRSSAAQGGFGDVRQGTLHPGGVKVAVKILLTHKNHGKKLEKRLRREINVWARCRHINVVPLLGKTLPFPGASIVGMVSPWMHHGNLHDYLGQHTNSLCFISRLNILRGVVAGLSYLHSKNIIHGDLNGGNVLLRTGGAACLTDFGLSSIMAEFEGTSYWSSTVGGAIRWRSTELFYDDPVLTKECDIYSFGCIMLQTLSNRVPYSEIKSDLRVAYEKFQEVLPQRPTGLSDAHWGFILCCLSTPPVQRPNLSGIRDCISAFQTECQGHIVAGR